MVLETLKIDQGMTIMQDPIIMVDIKIIIDTQTDGREIIIDNIIIGKHRVKIITEITVIIKIAEEIQTREKIVGPRREVRLRAFVFNADQARVLKL